MLRYCDVSPHFDAEYARASRAGPFMTERKKIPWLETSLNEIMAPVQEADGHSKGLLRP